MAYLDVVAVVESFLAKQRGIQVSAIAYTIFGWYCIIGFLVMLMIAVGNDPRGNMFAHVALSAVLCPAWPLFFWLNTRRS